MGETFSVLYEVPLESQKNQPSIEFSFFRPCVLEVFGDEGDGFRNIEKIPSLKVDGYSLESFFDFGIDGVVSLPDAVEGLCFTLVSAVMTVIAARCRNIFRKGRDEWTFG